MMKTKKLTKTSTQAQVLPDPSTKTTLRRIFTAPEVERQGSVAALTATQHFNFGAAS